VNSIGREFQGRMWSSKEYFNGAAFRVNSRVVADSEVWRLETRREFWDKMLSFWAGSRL
jgi:hypothetical protein